MSSFDSAQSNEPQNLYPLIWKVIAQSASEPSTTELNKAASSRDLTKWPGPIVTFFVGKSSPADLKVAAGTGDAAKLPGQRCEADVYLSEWQLLHHESTGVKEMLTAAVDECPTDFVELPVAKFELNRLTGQTHA
jgi:lipoprotein NlpI